MPTDKITIHGARQHNLKNIDVTLPKNQLVVITGLSGSGKSTLAFDTLYAEGQRRYVESLSTYARQFLGRLDKPAVDLIEGLSPAIAIEQKSAIHNPRSTVGTVTEIYDYLRLLYARIGVAYCYGCGRPIMAQSVDQMIDRIMAFPSGSRVIILAPLEIGADLTIAKMLRKYRTLGYARVRINSEIMEIETAERSVRRPPKSIDLVIDRLVLQPTTANRLADSLDLALAQGSGHASVMMSEGEMLNFSETSVCTRCGIQYPELTPAHFSFNSPYGACPRCDGLGAHHELDPQLIIPNHNLSLREGAVSVWAKRHSVIFAEFLEALTGHYGVDIYTPYKHLPERFKQVLLHGSKDEAIAFFTQRKGKKIRQPRPFEGLIPNLERRYQETTSNGVRRDIRRYMNLKKCRACKGQRLNTQALSVKVGEFNINQLTALSVDQSHTQLSQLKLEGNRQQIARPIVTEILQRLAFLSNVGLDYLTLNRAANTLSGGESQRIRLATQIGSKLTGVLYVLDEPSIGLHQRDHQQLLDTLISMRELGNTVVVVEHDLDTIRRAGFVVDMGPGAGVNGGRVVFAGPPKELLSNVDSLTGQYLSGRRSITVPSQRRKGNGKAIVIRGAGLHNLKKIDATVPLGVLVCVTGVSGSGKSSLVLGTLLPALRQHLHQALVNTGPYESIEGLAAVDKVVHIDQSAIGQTPRSNPGTYTGAFGVIRGLFSNTPDARARGYKASRFSFNVKGGRCEACQGAGIIKIEMHFLPDVYVTCDVCNGRRYNRETLEIRYKGRTIADVMEMTVNQTLAFFQYVPALRQKLETLMDVGLGYIKVGQPATTLSGGEAQRVRLARELGSRSTGRTLYILDEPTTGLHLEDVQKLLAVLNRLVASGNTVVVIEHHLDVIKSADYLLDLGPEGGEQGGYLVGAGTPEELAANQASHTGRYLQNLLG
jgi:excinuclease ABC subunit A